MLSRRLVLVFGGLGLLIVWSAWKALQSTQSSQPIKKVDFDGPFILSQNEVFLSPGGVKTVRILLRQPLPEDTDIHIALNNKTTIRVPNVISFKKYIRSAMTPLVIHADRLGENVITFQSTSAKVQDINKVKVKVHVVRSLYLTTLSLLVGWGYFLAWSVSYYPQVYENWRRRSVVGYSVDFVAISGTGQSCYAIYNAALCWSSTAKREFLEMYPGSELPVRTNDNFYTLHGVLLVSIAVVQCIFYDRGHQKISFPVLLLLGCTVLCICVALGGVVVSYITLLTWLNYLSFIKLLSAPLQYSPQVWLNYSNKSTKGWSIYGVFLDFSGGSLSFLQVMIDLSNTGDWDGVLANPVKLLLGLISMSYNIIFLMQHFILYRNKEPLR